MTAPDGLRRLRRTRRRPVLLVVVALGLAAAVVAVVVATRGPGPEDVVEDYLEAQWTGDWTAQCELATEQWRTHLYGGFPFADCAAYAEAAARALQGGADEDDPGGQATVTVDDPDVVVRRLSEGEGRARVEYAVTLGDEPGAATDRGTVELVEVDGSWRVAGVAGA